MTDATFDAAAPAERSGPKKAVIYRMEMPDHFCPYGFNSLKLLERRGYEIEDHKLTSRAEIDAFKAAHDVKTTPQTWIDGERVGGWDALAERLNHRTVAFGGRYQPVLAIFAVAAAAAGFMAWGYPAAMDRPMGIVGLFIAFATTILAVQKLQNVEKFQKMFTGYDLLTQKEPRYGYAYPFLEALAGVLMIGGVLHWLSAPIMLFIGTIGAVSVAKAVWIDKRELKCACVGGDSDVPLGFVSFTENAAMTVMGLWTLVWMLG